MDLRWPRRRRWFAAAGALAVIAVGAVAGGTARAAGGGGGVRESDAMLTGAGGVRLDTSYFTTGGAARRPAVLLAHGFGGSKDDVRGQAEKLARHGYAVLTWSARGFGHSGGTDRAQRAGRRGRRRQPARRLARPAARRAARRARRPAGRHLRDLVRRRDLAAGRRLRPPDRRDRAPRDVLEPLRRPVPRRRLQEAVGRHLLLRRLRRRTPPRPPRAPPPAPAAPGPAGAPPGPPCATGRRRPGLRPLHPGRLRAVQARRRRRRARTPRPARSSPR